MTLIALGLVMAGFVLSIIEGRLLLASRENYCLISFYIFVLITTGFVISEILISLDLVLAFSF